MAMNETAVPPYSNLTRQTLGGELEIIRRRIRHTKR